MGKKYGYISVSAKDQNPDRQLSAMQKEEVSKSHIFLDKMSGQDFARPEYMRLLKQLKPGDVVIVKSIISLEGVSDYLDAAEYIEKSVEVLYLQATEYYGAGVYNFMVTLRDKPEVARNYIKNGFLVK